MLTLTELEADVLDTIADDVENLEQIYKSLALDFSSKAYQPDDCSAFYWRQRSPEVALSDIADALLILMQKGIITVHLEDSQAIPSGLEYVWRGWFGLTQLGKTMLSDYYEKRDA